MLLIYVNDLWPLLSSLGLSSHVLKKTHHHMATNRAEEDIKHVILDSGF